MVASLRFVRTLYEPKAPPCECKANVHEWQFCAKHKLAEDELHLTRLIEHEERRKGLELLNS